MKKRCSLSRINGPVQEFPASEDGAVIFLEEAKVRLEARPETNARVEILVLSKRDEAQMDDDWLLRGDERPHHQTSEMCLLVQNESDFAH